MRDATLKQLRALVAVARAGTIASAAQALHVTAPAVGQQLKLLERTAGLPLLERTPTGLRLTEAGREVAAAANRIEAELTSCADLLQLMATGKSGSVSLGAVSTAKYFAPAALAAFWRDHPSIDVKLVIGNRHDMVAALTEHEVDLTIMGRPPAELDLETARIGDHPHVIIASPRHPLAAAGRTLPQKELEAATFLLREPESGTRQLTDRLLTSAGIQPTVAMEIQSNETIKQAVMADLGVALISAHTVGAEIADGRLTTLDVEGLPLMRHWYVVRPQAGRLLPAGAALWLFLVDHAVDHLPMMPAPAASGDRG
jgi:LysR family transcriptional regulator for metE and metH